MNTELLAKLKNLGHFTLQEASEKLGMNSKTLWGIIGYTHRQYLHVVDKIKTGKKGRPINVYEVTYNANQS
jgi:predicted ArsR family transcriptional regulator